VTDFQVILNGRQSRRDADSVEVQNSRKQAQESQDNKPNTRRSIRHLGGLSEFFRGIPPVRRIGHKILHPVEAADASKSISSRRILTVCSEADKYLMPLRLRITKIHVNMDFAEHLLHLTPRRVLSDTLVSELLVIPVQARILSVWE
jgi:hypothetical protein